MTLPIAQVFTPASAAAWLAALLGAAQTTGLDTTSWQSGGGQLTELQITAQSLSQEDAIASLFAQGGFLDYAATGTVTYTSSNGQVTTVPVTPAGGPGLLDVLASSVYNVQRIAATYASTSLRITNASGASYGPFAPGTYHVTNPTTLATYTNQASLTIAPGGTTLATIVADVAGTVGTSAANGITQPVTSLVGVTITNPTSAVGAAVETNAALAARCRLKLQSLSPNGPKGAYNYAALSATQAPFNAPLSQPITRVLVTLNTSTGVVTVTVANAGGPVAGVAQLAISGVTNNGSGLFRIAVANTAGISTGMLANVAGVQGCPNANGNWTLTLVDPTHVDLQGSTFAGAYTTGGTLEAGDLGLVDLTLQSFVVPDTVTELTQSATTTAVTFAVTVYVPSAYAGTVTGTVQSAIATYLATVPIGGVTTGIANQLPLNSVLGAIFEAAPYLNGATLLMNGSSADITLGSTAVPTISGSVAVTVVSQ